MDSKTSLCVICDLRHLTSPSTHWCEDCEEALCTNYKDHHNLSKASRDHEIIFMSEYNNLPSNIVNIDLYCTYHNEKYVQYCVDHACPTCYKCIREHGNCSELKLLEGLAGGVKVSEDFGDMEQRVGNIMNNIHRIRGDKKCNIELVKHKKHLIIEEVTLLRKKINRQLDTLQN